MFTLLTACKEGGVDDLPDTVDFNFHIRPILSNNCYTCHGPDPETREAGLRLDTYEGATALLESGERAISPGRPGKSGLVRRITATDEGIMPPPEANKHLSDREIALLKKWIRQGAEWKPHWAFIPPAPSELPEIKNVAADAHPIDRFIRSALERKGLEPAPPADKNALIRRLSYLLTGLPPAPQAVDDFLQDERSDAYERLVDRLLASPRFGERWARHWMDLARYAETRGHEFDYPINGAWRYRDYLIRAFNADVPYDRFLREQLAGDVLPEPRYDPATGINESILGTAFLTLGEGTHSPVDIRKDEADRIDNMIDVTTKSFQALTVSCARCHDHKFDPIPTTDYYSLYGIMESTRFAIRPAGDALQALATIDTIRQLKTAIREWIGSDAAGAPRVLTTANLSEGNTIAGEGAHSRIIGDFRDGMLAGWYPQGQAFGNALGEPLVDEKNRRLLGFAPAKASSRLYGEGLQDALRSPTFTIEHDKLLVRAAGHASMIRIVIDNFQLIQFPIHGGLEKWLKDQSQMADHHFDVSMWKGHKAYVELLNGHLEGWPQHGYTIQENAWIEAEYALAYSGAPPTPPPAESGAVDIDGWMAGQATPATVARLNALLRRGRLPRSLASLTSELDRIDKLSGSLYDSTFFSGVVEGDAVFSPVFVRGDHSELGKEQLPHRFFTVLDGSERHFTQTPSGRLELAEAMLDPQNPLTARVLVNRVWHHLFGRGIVETVDNFGLQGKIPSHPELLDHLALRLVEEGWSLKKLIRYIVLSNTFRQSTAASDGSRRVDPENLLLQHFPLRRMEAEAIRDAILAVSGQLDTTMYGPPVPVHLTEFMKGRGRPAASGPLDGTGRRSVYLEVRRNFLNPFMLTFDMPAPFSTFGRRNVSNVPAQSLTLMNDPFVAEQAHYSAAKVIRETPDEVQRIEQIYRSAFSRPPTSDELQAAHSFLEEQRKHYEPKTTEELELSLWSDFCHSILNMKEFIFLL